MTLMSPPQEIISHFCADPSSVDINSLGEGNINDTFLLCTAERSIVLQRINATVFPDPNILINNLLHLSHHFSSLTDDTEQRWQDLTLIPSLNGAPSIRDKEGAVWRALSYIEGSVCFSRAETELQAEQTGWALGHFHKRIAGLDVAKIQIPLPGFHKLGNYLKQYDQLSSDKKVYNSAKITICLQSISDNKEDALFLEKTCSQESHNLQTIHGDPKIANVLFDKNSGLAISLIDLDTVGPGILQHDIGDCLRSVCNNGGEESKLDKVTFDLNLCKATLKGYFEASGSLLTSSDRELIYDGIKAITYELGLRFFMDYLQGGIYFKCNKPEDTLGKALVQFVLLQDIIAKEDTIRNLTTF